MKVIEFIKVDPNGSSHFKDLSIEQEDVLKPWLESLESEASDDVLYPVDKFSRHLSIQFQGVKFAIYSRYGSLRIGAGGSYSDPLDITDQIINDFIETIN